MQPPVAGSQLSPGNCIDLFLRGPKASLKSNGGEGIDHRISHRRAETVHGAESFSFPAAHNVPRDNASRKLIKNKEAVERCSGEQNILSSPERGGLP